MRLGRAINCSGGLRPTRLLAKEPALRERRHRRLDGKKTHISLCLGLAYLVLVVYEVLPNSQLIWGGIVAAIVASLRSAIRKVEAR